MSEGWRRQQHTRYVFANQRAHFDLEKAKQIGEKSDNQRLSSLIALLQRCGGVENALSIATNEDDVKYLQALKATVDEERVSHFFIVAPLRHLSVSSLLFSFTKPVYTLLSWCSLDVFHVCSLKYLHRVSSHGCT